MPYRNRDPGAEKDAVQIAELTTAWFEKEIARVIKATYFGRNSSPISMELRHVAIDELRKIFFEKLLELKKVRRDNDWRYKAQDEIYPELKEDLRSYYPT